MNELSTHRNVSRQDGQVTISQNPQFARNKRSNIPNIQEKRKRKMLKSDTKVRRPYGLRSSEPQAASLEPREPPACSDSQQGCRWWKRKARSLPRRCSPSTSHWSVVAVLLGKGRGESSTWPFGEVIINLLFGITSTCALDGWKRWKIRRESKVHASRHVAPVMWGASGRTNVSVLELCLNPCIF